jgi:hypothetical protein
MNTTVEHDQTNTVNNTFTETIKSDTTVKITEGRYSQTWWPILRFTMCKGP